MRCIPVAFLSVLVLVGCGKWTARGLELNEMGISSNMVASMDGKCVSTTVVHEVVIVDYDRSPPQQYRLRVGETQDGIELVKADYYKGVVLIRRNGQYQRLPFGE